MYVFFIHLQLFGNDVIDRACFFVTHIKQTAFLIFILFLLGDVIWC